MIPIPNNNIICGRINLSLNGGGSNANVIPTFGGIRIVHKLDPLAQFDSIRINNKMFWAIVKTKLEFYLEREVEISVINSSFFTYQIKGENKPQSYEPILNNNYNADCNGTIHRPKTKAEIEAPVSPPKKNAGTNEYKKCGCWSRHD